jgi:hypothetical protein
MTKKPPENGVAPKVDRATFCRLWQASVDLRAFQETTGLNPRTSSHRACLYRADGEVLKVMPPWRHRGSKNRAKKK